MGNRSEGRQAFSWVDGVLTGEDEMKSVKSKRVRKRKGKKITNRTKDIKLHTSDGKKEKKRKRNPPKRKGS